MNKLILTEKILYALFALFVCTLLVRGYLGISSSIYLSVAALIIFLVAIIFIKIVLARFKKQNPANLQESTQNVKKFSSVSTGIAIVCMLIFIIMTFLLAFGMR